MSFDPSMFLWLRFVFQAFKLFISIFGSSDDKKEAEKNGFAP